MEKVFVTVLGQDRPGIIAAVTSLLFNHDCNLENVSQTTLHTEFAGLFIASMPERLTVERLREYLTDGLVPHGLRVYAQKMQDRDPHPDFIDGEPFIITARGPDRKGLVARISEVIADFGVNVTNLKAIFEGGDDPDRNIMIYEVDVPAGLDQKQFNSALQKKAEELGLSISIQHRRIFDTINRI